MINYLGNWSLSWSMSRKKIECSGSITWNMWSGLSRSKYILDFTNKRIILINFFKTNLEQFSEVAINLLAHKTPIVRQNTQQFLTKRFAMATQTTLPKKIFKIYLPALIKVFKYYYFNWRKKEIIRFLFFRIQEKQIQLYVIRHLNVLECYGNVLVKNIFFLI